MWGKTRRVRKDRKTKMHLALPSMPGDWRPRLSILFESGVGECQPLLPAPSHLSVLNVHQAVCSPEFLDVKERPSFIFSVFPSLCPSRPLFVKQRLVRRVACRVRQTFLLGYEFSLEWTTMHTLGCANWRMLIGVMGARIHVEPPLRTFFKCKRVTPSRGSRLME